MGEAWESDFSVTELWALYSILLGGSSAHLELNTSSSEDQILTGNQTRLAKTWFDKGGNMASEKF